jgi:hypothetical protein
MTTALQFINSRKPYTLAGFEPGIFSSVGGAMTTMPRRRGQGNIYIFHFNCWQCFQFLWHWLELGNSNSQSNTTFKAIHKI